MLHWNIEVVQMICFTSFRAGFNHKAHDLMMHMLMSCYAYAQMQAKHLGCYSPPPDKNLVLRFGKRTS
jgi:hypothetical protein